MLCIEIQPPKCRPFLVLSWYRPQNSPVSIFTKVEKVLSYLDKEAKDILIIGCTNCDLSSQKNGSSSDSNSRHIRDLYQLFSLKQIIDEPTRVTLTSSTLIDHISTTCVENITASGVHKLSLSDHYMVFCTRKLNASVSGGHKQVITRNMKRFNEQAFIGGVTSFCWKQIVHNTDDINSMVWEWSSIFSAIIEKHAPIREIRMSDKNSP